MNDGRLSVLHVAQPLDAGVPAYVRQVATDQAARGWHVTVASPPTGDLARWLDGPTGIAYEQWTATRSPGPSVVVEARRLRKIVRAVSADIVHLHSAKAGLAGRLAVRGKHTTIYQPHSWSFNAVGGVTARLALSWERFGARWSDATVCVSASERDEGRAAGIRGRMEVVHNGVDLARWTAAGDRERQEAREALGLPQGPLAVSVGRLSPQKGQDVLLRAWAAVTAAHPDARLVLVGDGPDRDALEAASPEGVTFAGKRDDVARWLAAADLVVLPSRWEGLSLGLLEALARARSIVTTEVAGAREAVGDDAGAVVAVEDHSALAEAIVRRFDDPALRAREEDAARKRAERLFDVTVTNERVAALYRELAKR